MSTTQVLRPARTSRRPSFTTLALVGALHIVVIYGLYLGLTGNYPKFIPHGPIVVVPVPPTPPQPADPTHVKFIKPTVPTDHPPKIPVDNSVPDKGPTITQPRDQTDLGPVNPVVVAARGIMSTHSTPDYPLMAVRLNQTGNVMLKLSIDEHGAVVAATVEKSSGYDSLDSAAVAWVIAHWRYEPATKDGKPFATNTDAVVTFRLTGR
jgi:periplasmic protein TonB